MSTYECIHAGPVAAGAALPALTVSATAGTTLGSWLSVDGTASLVNAGDDNANNDAASMTIPIGTTGQPVDLSVTVTGAGPVQAGGSAAYTLQVNYTGFLDSSGPVMVSVPSADAAGSGWSCDPTSSNASTAAPSPPAGTRRY